MKYVLLCLIFAINLPLSAQKSVQKGKASYYADKFNGRKTASGEIFSNDSLTAAHPKYPFGTMIRVTNLANKKSVVVRVNDRGPHVKSRIVDLSKRAARAIDGIRAGIIDVKVELIRLPNGT